MTKNPVFLAKKIAINLVKYEKIIPHNLSYFLYAFYCESSGIYEGIYSF